MTQIKHAINEEYKSEVFLMDCMEGMKQYDDNHFDLAVCDPPYGISVNSMVMGGRKTVPKDDRQWDESVPTPEYFKELFRVSKNQIIWGGNYFGLPATRCFLIWDKKIAEDMSFAMCEMAWTSFDRSAKIYKKSATDLTRFHATQKPINLYEWVFKNYAECGMSILDTHLGSGSSRIAANLNKLNFTGFEIDKEYFDKSNKRYEDHVSQLTLF